MVSYYLGRFQGPRKQGSKDEDSKLVTSYPHLFASYPGVFWNVRVEVLNLGQGAGESVVDQLCLTCLIKVRGRGEF